VAFRGFSDSPILGSVGKRRASLRVALRVCSRVGVLEGAKIEDQLPENFRKRMGTFEGDWAEILLTPAEVLDRALTSHAAVESRPSHEMGCGLA